MEGSGLRMRVIASPLGKIQDGGRRVMTSSPTCPDLSEIQDGGHRVMTSSWHVGTCLKSKMADIM